jgi:SAM-dependent methyltransferase
VIKASIGSKGLKANMNMEQGSAAQNPIRLHIGSGQTRIEGFVNIDQLPGTDLCMDLNTTRLPFKDGSVDCVFGYHALEHFDNYLFVLGEIWRVLRHGGRLLIEVPYVTLSEYNLVNPYHKQHFSEHSFDFFEIGKLKSSANEDSPILFTKGWHRFHYLPEFEHVPEPERSHARRHMFNVVRAIDFGLYAVKPPETLLELKPGMEEALEAEFERHFGARIGIWPPLTGRCRPPSPGLWDRLRRLILPSARR